MHKRLISVIMAAYDAQEHIDAAIDSLRRQTVSDWELIVVDDCSRDATCERVLAASADPRIRLIRMPENGGPGAARNTALDHVRGEWVTILDADDRYEPDRLETLLDRARKDDLDVVADNLSLFDSEGRRVVSRGFRMAGFSCRLTPARLARNDGPPRIASLGHVKPFIRAEFLARSGVRYPVDLRLGEDFWFLYRLTEKTSKAVLIDYAGYIYTLPFGVETGRRSQNSRTPYCCAGVDQLRHANAALRAEVSGHDVELAQALDDRAAYLADDRIWREVRAFVSARRYLSAFVGLARMRARSSWACMAAALRFRFGRFETRIA